MVNQEDIIRQRRNYEVNKAYEDEFRGKVLQKLGKSKKFRGRAIRSVQMAGQRLIEQGGKLIDKARKILKKYGELKPQPKKLTGKLSSEIKKKDGKIRRIVRKIFRRGRFGSSKRDQGWGKIK